MAGAWCAKKPVTGDNLKAALATIKDWDTGGITGQCHLHEHTRPPWGASTRPTSQKGIFEPVSDWITSK